jgi:glycine betaine/proline transport system substrate-binding protein
MKRMASLAILGAFMLPAAAKADCGVVSITEMNWASASVVTNVAAFLMEEGYGCDVTVVPSDTVPAVTSVAENNEPDIVTELWLNSAGDAYRRLEETGQIRRVAEVLDPGGVEGWWIPTYLADAHPELATLEGVLANPDLVGGLFHNCPDGWGCRVVNDNLDAVINLEANGIEVFDHGSGETLATSMASAVQNEEPWFGYYWGPTVPLGKFDMTRVEIGPIDEEIHGRNQNAGTDSPGISDFPAAPILTAVTADFAEREPEIAELMSNMTFKTDTMSGILAWMEENGANSEEGAVYFLTNFTDEWSAWVNDEARENLAALLN